MEQYESFEHVKEGKKVENIPHKFTDNSSQYINNIIGNVSSFTTGSHFENAMGESGRWDYSSPAEHSLIPRSEWPTETREKHPLTAEQLGAKMHELNNTYSKLQQDIESMMENDEREYSEFIDGVNTRLATLKAFHDDDYNAYYKAFNEAQRRDIFDLENMDDKETYRSERSLAGKLSKYQEKIAPKRAKKQMRRDAFDQSLTSLEKDHFVLATEMMWQERLRRQQYEQDISNMQNQQLSIQRKAQSIQKRLNKHQGHKGKKR